VNDAQVGPIFQFMLDNCDRMSSVSFQPVSFTGRDEGISDEDRRRQRYTISHLAHELQRYTDGRIDPHRDWYPLGAIGAFSWLADHLRGPDVKFGGLSCSCHPNCGSSVFMMANTRTKAWAPVTQFFNMDRFVEDVAVIGDTSRGQVATLTQVALALLRNFDQRKAPPGLSVLDLLKCFNMKTNGALMAGRKPETHWKLLWIGGMWFQDLWTYDFRRTEMCVIPYATQEGEISFCAYNTGVGWRQIIENMHMVATTKDWFQARGRHKIYAGNRAMDLPSRALPVLGAHSSGTEAGCGSGCGCH
jgi:uncharacterized radical SAM superfamily Fe-S cluster-containing enzyme